MKHSLEQECEGRCNSEAVAAQLREQLNNTEDRLSKEITARQEGAELWRGSYMYNPCPSPICSLVYAAIQYIVYGVAIIFVKPAAMQCTHSFLLPLLAEREGC